jgi:hypothetical protein
MSQEINELIKSSGIDTNNVSDGYHTFGELYEHRIELFITLCRVLQEIPHMHIWCSKKQSDGQEFEGWFLLGIHRTQGDMITYHLPIKDWERVCEFACVLDIAHPWDGHTSSDVLLRLKQINGA